MKIKLIKSLKRDNKIINVISKLYSHSVKKKFYFKVKITKKRYLKMIQNKYISTLSNLSKKDLLKGIEEINLRYKKTIKFSDKLICLIL